MSIPNYYDIKHALQTATNLVTPAELHGILCGLICAGLNRFDAETLPETLHLDLPADTDACAINATLNVLFTNTQQKIEQFELDFQLLLPAEDTPLNERAQEFGKWCEGFLSGIGLCDAPHEYKDKEEVDDILYKLSEAAKIAFDEVDFSETDEAMFAEVTEFVRLCVFAIYNELCHSQQGPFSDLPQGTVH